MTVLESVVLGIIQGLTEFLPVSSSGHLVLAQHLLNVKQPGLAFELLLHLGSLLSVLVYFHKKIGNMLKAPFIEGMVHERRLIGAVVIGTIPAVVAVLLFRDIFETAFTSPIFTAAMLLVTGAILLSTRFVQFGDEPVGIWKALTIGIGQALAIFPGISRSGTTIATGLWAKVKPTEAAEFSFLLSIPAIFGAIVFKFKEISNVPPGLWVTYLIGVAVTFVFSLMAVYAVMTIIKKGKFVYFAYYCFAVGAVALYFFW